MGFDLRRFWFGNLGSTSFEYQEVVFNPLYGMVSIADLPQERSLGARWSGKAHTWVSAAAKTLGREPYTALLVQGQTKEGDTFLLSLSEMTASPGSEKRPDQKLGLHGDLLNEIKK